MSLNERERGEADGGEGKKNSEAKKSEERAQRDEEGRWKQKRRETGRLGEK